MTSPTKLRMILTNSHYIYLFRRLTKALPHSKPKIFPLKDSSCKPRFTCRPTFVTQREVTNPKISRQNVGLSWPDFKFEIYDSRFCRLDCWPEWLQRLCYWARKRRGFGFHCCYKVELVKEWVVISRASIFQILQVSPILDKSSNLSTHLNEN